MNVSFAKPVCIESNVGLLFRFFTFTFDLTSVYPEISFLHAFSISLTVLSQSTAAASCKGVDSSSSTHRKSAPALINIFTISTWLWATAVCSGVISWMSLALKWQRKMKENSLPLQTLYIQISWLQTDLDALFFIMYVNSYQQPYHLIWLADIRSGCGILIYPAWKGSIYTQTYVKTHFNNTPF